jgi:hypothetical protein
MAYRTDCSRQVLAIGTGSLPEDILIRLVIYIQFVSIT